MRVIEVFAVTINGGLVKRFKSRPEAEACLEAIKAEHGPSTSVFSPFRIERGHALEVDTPSGAIMYFALSAIGVES